MQTTSLTILGTSDIHGMIYPISYHNNESQPYGLARLATYIKTVRNQEENMILIDNGDCIQGTPLMYHYVHQQSALPNPVIKAFNHLGYDAAVIGNHEFNYGRNVVDEAVQQSTFPWLSANTLEKNKGVPYFGKPYIIKEFKEGLRIAVLGLTTQFIPNWENPKHIECLHFIDGVHAAEKWVSYIEEHESPDAVVVSYHGGFERDPETGEPTEKQTGENVAYELCQRVKGIDVLLTGHQHLLLSGDVNGVSIVQPGFNGSHIGRVDLYFEKDETNSWKLKRKKTSLLSMENIEADNEVLHVCQPYERSTQAWLDRPIGTITGDMTISDPHQVRLREHPFIEFVNKVQMEVADAPLSLTSLFNNHAKGFSSSVTMRDIVTNYVYPNTLTVLELSGDDIRAALERSASYFMPGEQNEIIVNPEFYDPKPQHYNYDMWEGIEYVITVGKPVGQRISNLFYQGKELESTSFYPVVMNSYRAVGGGDYFMFKDKKILKEIQIDMTEILANYFQTHRTVVSQVNNNWTVKI
ncbi:2', 3'-cyclic nucleotide 2'-phosphodiesterase [Bacillus coahuilensis m2-6]|uniref:bifunctional metallophosphatase/5'-nucleotidase n=1 Tax=Bacillus coahuilensis TaxID=408580 RepID=UPI0007500DCE|nr:bifunctional UDP-sugar hydrolase/5'-nucleotidase [Bacillus coahuilensis]KUP05396.1 2', 3'-cyclic nucleotide 2'-phosphodiesterase [Bacillus coahuilensis m2-6]